jgi:hypothetical protein
MFISPDLQSEEICLKAVKTSPFNIAHIKYPSIFLVDKILSITDISYVNLFDYCYVTELTANYSIYANSITNIYKHHNELLYRSNNIASLECGKQWTHIGTKYLFLTL